MANGLSLYAAFVAELNFDLTEVMLGNGGSVIKIFLLCPFLGRRFRASHVSGPDLSLCSFSRLHFVRRRYWSRTEVWILRTRCAQQLQPIAALLRGLCQSVFSFAIFCDTSGHNHEGCSLAVSGNLTRNDQGVCLFPQIPLGRARYQRAAPGASAGPTRFAARRRSRRRRRGALP